jgi:transcriptional regulator with XRE-family HTH domain
MDDKVKVITYSSYIRDARVAKNMTINDLAFVIDKNNVKKVEKKIKNWEAGKDYPDLDDIYKLAYILEINPGELLTIRNRGRKQFVKKEEDKPKKHDMMRALDISYYSIIAFARIFLAIALIVFVIWLLKFVDVFYGDTGAKLEQKAITYEINEALDGNTNVQIHK